MRTRRPSGVGDVVIVGVANGVGVGVEVGLGVAVGDGVDVKVAVLVGIGGVSVIVGDGDGGACSLHADRLISNKTAITNSCSWCFSMKNLSSEWMVSIRLIGTNSKGH
jgi:hypothetical protein